MRVLTLIIFGVLAIATGVGLYAGYYYIDRDPQFCQSCHIMEEPFRKWSSSPHHLVTCNKCHQQSLMEGIHQVWFYLTQRPQEVTHHPQLDSTLCAGCHLSEDPQWKLIGATAGHRVHFEKAGIDCLTCHSGGVHKIVRPVDTCLTCHADKVEGPGKKMAFAHCTDCHTFLAEQDDLIPTRETCLACHRKITVGHATFPEDAPMVAFDCAVCHKPHGATRPDRELCLSCHADATPPHHGLKTGGTCVDCHTPHHWRTE